MQYMKQFLSQFQNVQNCNDDIISVNIFLKFSFYWILLSNIGASVYLYEEPSMWKEMWKVDNPRAAAINLRKNLICYILKWIQEIFFTNWIKLRGYMIEKKIENCKHKTY